MYHLRLAIYFSGTGLYNSFFVSLYLLFLLYFEFGVIVIDVIIFVQMMGEKFAIIIMIVCVP